MSDRIRAADVAKLTSLSVRGVQQLAARGMIPGASRLGKVWTFDPARVRAWIRSMERCPSERHEDATGAGQCFGGSSPSPAASIAAAYERLIHAKPHAGTAPGATR